MRPIAFFAACIAAAAAVPARAQTTPPPAPADSVVRAAPPAAPAAPAPRPRRNPNVITTAELEGQVATDVYELVQRLRPQWLRARPSGSSEEAVRRTSFNGITSGSSSPLHVAVSVVIGDRRVGDTDELHRLQIGNVRELRFIPGRDAITRWGRDLSDGAIEVFMR